MSPRRPPTRRSRAAATRSAASSSTPRASTSTLRALESAAGTLSGSTSAVSQEWVDYKVTRRAATVDAALAAKREDVRRKWGYGLGRLTTGTVDLKFTGGGETEF
jgi:hypothetical protein